MLGIEIGEEVMYEGIAYKVVGTLANPRALLVEDVEGLYDRVRALAPEQVTRRSGQLVMDFPDLEPIRTNRKRRRYSW